jgi:hypothetical protein
MSAKVWDDLAVAQHPLETQLRLASLSSCHTCSRPWHEPHRHVLRKMNTQPLLHPTLPSSFCCHTPPGRCAGRYCCCVLQVLVDSVTISGFDDLMVSECMRLLEDDEVRVRLAVGQLLRSLAAKHGLSVLQACQDTVLNSIHTHFVSIKQQGLAWRNVYVCGVGLARLAVELQQWTGSWLHVGQCTLQLPPLTSIGPCCRPDLSRPHHVPL